MPDVRQQEVFHELSNTILDCAEFDGQKGSNWRDNLLVLLEKALMHHNLEND